MLVVREDVGVCCAGGMLVLVVREDESTCL